MRPYYCNGCFFAYEESNDVGCGNIIGYRIMSLIKVGRDSLHCIIILLVRPPRQWLG